MGLDWQRPICSTVKGRSHELEDTDCQDAFFHGESRDGRWKAVCVCDGAGSAIFGAQGASIIAEAFCKGIIEIGNILTKRSPGAWVNDAVIESIVNIRQELRELAASDDISNYHTTLLAVLVGPSGGFYVHIGDGAIFGGTTKCDGLTVVLDDTFFISKPENGEFQNETFFVTEFDWVKHLRIAPLPTLDWIGLATDGATAVSLLDNLVPQADLPSLIQKLVQEKDFANRTQILTDYLSRPESDLRTNDDKTIAVILSTKLTPERASAFMLKENASYEQAKRTPNQAVASNNSRYLKSILNCRNAFIVLIVSTVVAAILLTYFCFYAGRKKPKDELTKNAILVELTK